jgi:hypothetical protein
VVPCIHCCNARLASDTWLSCHCLAIASPDSLAAASFSWPMSWNSARSSALGASPARAMRSVRMRITEPEDSSISWVLSASSNHCERG